jgi:hypothetical protein
VSGCWLKAVGERRSALGVWRSAFGVRLSAFGCRLSAVAKKRKENDVIFSTQFRNWCVIALYYLNGLNAFPPQLEWREK